MSTKNRYYVYRDEAGKVRRLAMIGTVKGEFCAYGYESGGWVAMPALFKIEWEVTDYDEITEAEAKKIMEEI